MHSQEKQHAFFLQKCTQSNSVHINTLQEYAMLSLIHFLK